MHEFEGILILLGIALAISGPAAFIMALVSLLKSNQLKSELERIQFELTRQRYRADSMPVVKTPEAKAPVPVKVSSPDELRFAEPVELDKPIPAQPTVQEQDEVIRAAAHTVSNAACYTPSPISKPVFEPAAIREGLESRIGTQWLLVAGIITVIIAVIFFLKYAFDNHWLEPKARVILAIVGGFISLAIGELTRRRGYDVVAKGVTALGFGILYAAVFSAYKLHGLIEPTTAFGLAIAITAGAMAYAVGLNEILIAFLSLLGGYLTPILVTTGKNTPNALFGYLLVLGAGAMVCAAFRRWRAINILSFVGTLLLYTMWFENFIRPIMPYAEAHPSKFFVAELWLWIFFVLYLVMPVLHSLVRKVQSQEEDILLTLTNGIATFYYLWTMLFEHHRSLLAAETAILGAAYLAVMTIAYFRNRADGNMRATLLVIGLSFITGAMGLYFKAYALPMSFAIEGVVLTAAGLWFASILTLGAGFIAFGLAAIRLLWLLPLHTDEFRPILNGPFGSWMFLAAGLFACHWLYRLKKDRDIDHRRSLSELMFVAAAGVAAAVGVLEWHCYWNYNTSIGDTLADAKTVQGVLYALSILVVLVLLRPFSPDGLFCRVASAAAAVIVSLLAVFSIELLYPSAFWMILNAGFAAQCAAVAAIFIAAVLYRRQLSGGLSPAWYQSMALIGVIVLWLVLSEQLYTYWYCQNEYGIGVLNWKFKANLSLSLLWAAYASAMLIVGFWKRLTIVRFLALGLFGILLIKIFIVDMATVKSIYRILAFMATGLTLVGVSYWYQFLKKQGFFEAMQSSQEQHKKII